MTKEEFKKECEDAGLTVSYVDDDYGGFDAFLSSGESAIRWLPELGYIYSAYSHHAKAYTESTLPSKTLQECLGKATLLILEVAEEQLKCLNKTEKPSVMVIWSQTEI